MESQFRSLLVDDFRSSTFVSFDIDSISGSDCPGVSCPATVGLTAEEALRISFEAGKSQKVC